MVEYHITKLDSFEISDIIFPWKDPCLVCAGSFLQSANNRRVELQAQFTF